MAMLIAWQRWNAVRLSGSKHFTRGFSSRRRVSRSKIGSAFCQPNDSDNYYATRELVPATICWRR